MVRSSPTTSIPLRHVLASRPVTLHLKCPEDWRDGSMMESPGVLSEDAGSVPSIHMAAQNDL